MTNTNASTPFRLLTALIVVFICSNSYALHVNQVFSKLKFVSGLSKVKLYYESCDVTAYASGNSVTLCYEGLSEVRNDDELARLLGHELGHIALGHRRSSISHEYAADAMAAQYMRAAHYNICRGAKLLKRRNNPESDDHPSDYSRWLRFNCK